MSVAYTDGKPSVFHTYVLAGEIARLYQSCSEFRFDGNAHRNAISRANRYLHWKDMLSLRIVDIGHMTGAAWVRSRTPVASINSRWASAATA